MGNGIYNALSGAVTQARVLEVVSNNLANVNTPGYKAGRVSFQEVLSKTTAEGGAKLDSYVKEAQVRTDVRPGALRPTDRKLDVALEGRGYLCVQDGAKEAYTRGGGLHLKADGVVTDAGGLPLLTKGGSPLRLTPGTDVSRVLIDSAGAVSADGMPVGMLKVVEFTKPEALERSGSNRYSQGQAGAAQAASTTGVRQGFLESANFNMVRGISSMIVASRTYEAFHRVISTFREVDTRVVNNLGSER